MFATAKRQTFNGRDVLAHLAYTHAPSTASESGRKDKKTKSNVYFIADRYRQAFYEMNLPPFSRQLAQFWLWNMSFIVGHFFSCAKPCYSFLL